ncbi:MAG: oxidoreductase [Pseudoxanthomonas sp.]
MHPILNVALVGYGFVGKVFHAPLIASTEGLRLHTVVSRDPDKVHADHAQACVVSRPEIAFADPAIDMVVIAAPNAVHASLAHAALDHGKHVVVDKPFTVTLAEAREVIAHGERAQRIVSVFQNRRWDADFLSLRELIDNGALGEVAEFHSHFDRHRPSVADRWRERDQPGSGLWYDLGPHLVDQALQLFGLPDAVSADIAMQRDGACVDDYFHVVLRYPRRRVILHAGSLVPAHGLRFAVHGSHGSYIKHGMDPQEAALREGAMPGQAGWGIDPRPGVLHVDGEDTTIAGTPGNYRTYYTMLRAAILANTPPPVTTREAMQVMGLLEEARESSQRRCQVDTCQVAASD